MRHLNKRIWLLLWVVGLLLVIYFLGPLFLWTYHIERASRLVALGLGWPSSRGIDSQPILKDGARLEEALPHLAAAMSWRPNNERAYRLASQIYVGQGDLIKAAETLERARVFAPANPLLAWDASLVYERMWQARLLVPRDEETNPYTRFQPDVRMRTAWKTAGVDEQEFIRQASISSNNINVAQAWIARARMADMNTAEAWRSLGQVYRQVGDLNEAQAAYREASSLAPQNRDIWYELGSLYLQSRKGTEALTAYAKALDAPSGTVGLSLIYYQIGIVRQRYVLPRDPAGAWDAYEQALAQDDFGTNPATKVQTYVQRGQLRVGEQRWDDALAEYTRALALDQENVNAHYARAVVFLRMGDQTQAREALDSLIRLKPDYKESYRLLGNLAKEEDNLAEARRMYQRVLELDPKDERARKALEALK